MVALAFLIGNLNREHGGAQQLLFDLCSRLPHDFDATVFYMFGEATFREDFEQEGVTVVDIGAQSNYDLRAFARLVARLRDFAPDIIQTNSTISGVWGRVAGSLAGVPVVVSVEHNVHDSYRPFARYANGLTLPLADCAVGVSESVSESLFPRRLLAAAGTERRMIHNGVDIKRIEAAFDGSAEAFEARTGLNPEASVLGTVGRLSEQKGFDVLLEAFPAVRSRVSDVQLVVVGGGPDRSALEAKASSLGVADAVVFTGYVPSVFPLLPHFDVATFPSRWEGFGLVAAEAMVAKRPVVASDIPALREVVDEAGVLVPPEKPNALGAAIASLFEEPSRRDRLGKAGYCRVTSEFSIERTVEEYVSLYRELVKQ